MIDLPGFCRRIPASSRWRGYWGRSATRWWWCRSRTRRPQTSAIACKRNKREENVAVNQSFEKPFAPSPSTSYIGLCSILMWTSLTKFTCEITRTKLSKLNIVFWENDLDAIFWVQSYVGFFHKILNAPSYANSFFWQLCICIVCNGVVLKTLKMNTRGSSTVCPTATKFLRQQIGQSRKV